MHEGLCLELKMLGLIVEMCIFGNGIVAAIGLRVWLSCDGSFSMFTKETLVDMIRETRKLFSSLQ